MIKNNLDRIMWERKLTARELAELAGLSHEKVSQIRNNPGANITTVTIEKLCRALKLQPGELLAWEVEENTAPLAA